MTRITSVFVGTALVVGLAAVPAFAQNSPAGTWDVVLESPQGAQNITMTVTVTGDKAEGTLASAMGTMPITGTAKADSIEMSGTMDLGGMQLQLGITGKVVADAISGSVKLGDFGDAPFSGKRGVAKESAPAAAPTAAAASTTGVNGKWDVTLMLPGMGEFPLTATLTQTGDAVTGTIVSLAGEVAVAGTFKAPSLNLEFNAETPQGALKVTMTGELKDQGLTGKATISGMGEADWKAVRGQ